MLPGLEGVFVPAGRKDRWSGPAQLSLSYVTPQQAPVPGWRILRCGVLVAVCDQDPPAVLPTPAGLHVWRRGLWPNSPEIRGGLVVWDFW